jgi:hypothetical protein
VLFSPARGRLQQMVSDSVAGPADDGRAPASGVPPQRIVSAMTAFWTWSRFSASS